MVVFKEKKRPRNMTEDELRDHKRLLGRMASKRYYDKHRERLRSEKSKRYEASDKTAVQKYGRDYYLANQERLKAASLARYYKLKNGKVDSDVVEVDEPTKKIST